MAQPQRDMNGIEVPGCVVKEIEKKLYKTLKDVFHYDSYKSLVQKRAVEAVADSGQDVFVSMPTGAGKSLCYQLPALVSERDGITIVVSPLIALMTDQMKQMKELGVCTETINSKMKNSERERVKDDLISSSPRTKLLYITPELASTPGFKAIVNRLHENNRLARFVVDEAHCVSQWGHNFRPDYLRLGEIKEKYPSVPWVALTATASVKVMDDILLLLKLCQPVAIFKTSCFRPNLFYDVVFKENLDDPYEDLFQFALSALGDLWEMTPPSDRGCGIVYCRTRDACEEVAAKLSKLGLLTRPYHAGMKPALREEVQTGWMDGKITAIAATVSFGMGIDKPTVRFVAHWSVSQSVAGYYQESGRAGRDGNPAKCRIYYSRADRETIRFLLKKDEKTSKSKQGKTKCSVAIKSFDTMIKYCEDVVCRHYLLSREFGDDIPDCRKYCDVCCFRKTVERSVQQFHNSVLACKMKLDKFSRGSDDFSGDLYGSGRKGIQEDSQNYYDDDDESSVSREKDAARALSKLISEEFGKRRGEKKNEKLFISNTSILEPYSKHIPEVTHQMRSEYFNKLKEEIKAHLSACSKNSECPSLSEKDVKECAAEFELSTFKTKTNIHMYRRELVHIFKSLREASRQVEVHPLVTRHLQPKNREEKPKSCDAPKERLHKLVEFAASGKRNKECCKPDFNISSSQSCASSQRTIGGSSRHSDYSHEGDSRKKRKLRAVSTDSSQHMLSDSEKPRMYKAFDDSNSETSETFSRDKILSPKSNCTETRASMEDTKPMIKYFFESVTNSGQGCVSRFGSVDKTDRTSVPKSPDKSYAASKEAIAKELDEPLRRILSSPVGSSGSQKRRKSDCSDSEVPHFPDKLQKKGTTKTIAQIHNDDLKKAADLVRKHLNPKYKENKISKDLFKIVCRSISHRLVDSGTINDKAAKCEVEKLFVEQIPIAKSSLEPPISHSMTN